MDTIADLQAYRTTHGITWTMALGTDAIDTAYDTGSGVPALVLIDPGWITYSHMGAVDAATLISLIDSMQPKLPPQPPVASFVWSPDPGIVGQPITFDASSSSDPDGTIVYYGWDFYDGTGSGVSVTHTYGAAGIYPVRLTVIDNSNLTDTTVRNVTVRPPPEIHVHVDIKPGSCPNPINVDSKGVFAVAIKGTEDFDVRTVDPATVKLYIEGIAEGVSPIRWSYEDVALADGYLDIVFHFDTQTVVTKLGLAGHLGETLPLIIKGNLLPTAGGTPIQGQDYVWILPKT